MNKKHETNELSDELTALATHGTEDLEVFHAQQPQAKTKCGVGSACGPQPSSKTSKTSDVTVTGLPTFIPERSARQSASLYSIVTQPWPMWAIEMSAEAMGTMMITFLGTATVGAAVLTGAQQGIFQVAAVWGIIVSLSIYISAHISGAHLNPAVSFAFVLLKRASFPWRKCLRYWLAQLIGGIVGGLLTYAVWSPSIFEFEITNGVARGLSGSEKSAMVLCQYFPNPGAPIQMVSFGQAFAVEMIGTAILMMVIFSLNDPCNNAVDRSHNPVMVGACITMLISIFGPLTMAGFNPARDFGPRIVAWMFGWGSVALPAPSSGFLVYLLAPMVGAPLGGLLTTSFLRRPCKDERCD